MTTAEKILLALAAVVALLWACVFIADWNRARIRRRIERDLDRRQRLHDVEQRLRQGQRERRG